MTSTVSSFFTEAHISLEPQNSLLNGLLFVLTPGYPCIYNFPCFSQNIYIFNITPVFISFLATICLLQQTANIIKVFESQLYLSVHQFAYCQSVQVHFYLFFTLFDSFWRERKFPQSKFLLQHTTYWLVGFIFNFLFYEIL